MNSADMGIILTSLNLKKDYPLEAIYLVTEETQQNNDNKLFKKIPAICLQLDIPTINMQELIHKFDDIHIEFRRSTSSNTEEGSL